MKVKEDNNEQISIALDKYSDMIYRIAWQYTKSIHDAEDILQETLFRLIENNPTFNDDEHEKAWLIRVTVNLCRDRLRSVQFRRIISLEDVQEQTLTYEDKNNDILDIVMHLPPKYRIVLYLYYYESYTINDIAKILKTKPNTISSRLTRARAQLKLIIEEGDMVYEGK